MPIADDEILYRRVPRSRLWYDPATGELQPEAFEPHKKNDVTGISVTRALYKTVAEAAASGQPGKEYFVAGLAAGDIRGIGLSVISSPHVPGGFDISHAEIPELNAANRKLSATRERMHLLVGICRGVDGPFLVPPAAS